MAYNVIDIWSTVADYTHNCYNIFYTESLGIVRELEVLSSPDRNKGYFASGRSALSKVDETRSLSKDIASLIVR